MQGVHRRLPWAPGSLAVAGRSLVTQTQPPPLLMSATPSEGQTRDQ